jgi:hemoglobin-like flavoprotein
VDEQLQPLTAIQVEHLKKTFRMMDPSRLAMRFYSSLFVLHPEVKSLFPDDLTVQSTKIVSVFELVVYSFQENSPGKFTLQPEILRPLRNLGELHNQKGVIDKYYPWVNELLLKCMREECPADFTSEIELAWKLALNHITVAMLSNTQSGPDSQHETMRDSFNHIRSLLFKT